MVTGRKTRLWAGCRGFLDTHHVIKVAMIEQFIEDDEPVNKLASPEVSLWGNVDQDGAWLDAVMAACVVVKTIMEVLDRNTGKAIDQGSGWIQAVTDALGA